MEKVLEILKEAIVIDVKEEVILEKLFLEVLIPKMEAWAKDTSTPFEIDDKAVALLKELVIKELAKK